MALGLGLFTGLFFGDMAGFLQILAEIFVLLLQMTVLPYVTLSLIVGFGRLTYADAKMLAVKGTAVLLLLWCMAFIVLLLMPLAFPDWESASFFSSAMIEPKQDVNYLEIFIPANPFYSMSRSLVPAVVVFSICVGVALIGVQDKHHLITTFSMLKKALMRVTDWMVSLMPIGIFVIAASAAGTLQIAEFERLQVYLILYIVVTILFTFWILPGLVAALTPITYRELLGISKDAMVTAFMTATLLVVIPLLVENSKSLLNRKKLETGHSGAVLHAIIPTSFNFPQSGKILAMSFILFAAWFTDNPLSFSEYPLLMISGLASFFGSLSVAIPFLLDLMHIPADMFQLFVISSVLNSRFGTLLAAMHTLVLGILVACAVTGSLRIESKKILKFIVITVILTAATIGGSKVLFEYGLTNDYKKDQIFSGMDLIRDPVSAIVYKTAPKALADDSPEKSKQASIRERGYIRIGYVPNGLPYSFFNSSENLVGFDIEMAHMLARDLGVSIEFVPVGHSDIAKQLDSNYCDIVMSGIVETTRRAEVINFSTSYLEETVAFIVKDYRRKDFSISGNRKELKSVKIADFTQGHPDYIGISQRYFPQAEFAPIKSIEDFFNDKQDNYDAILSTAQRGAAWSLIYPDFTVALPRPELIKVPLAYPVSYQNPDFARFINTWVKLKKMDGTIDSLYDYWVLGKSAVSPKPRWSIIRDVLHWVD